MLVKGYWWERNLCTVICLPTDVGFRIMGHADTRYTSVIRVPVWPFQSTRSMHIKATLTATQCAHVICTMYISIVFISNHLRAVTRICCMARRVAIPNPLYCWYSICNWRFVKEHWFTYWKWLQRCKLTYTENKSQYGHITTVTIVKKETY